MKQKIQWQPIVWQDIKKCFSSEEKHKYKYLGYTFNLFEPEVGEPYEAIQSIIRLVDKKARPWWCPRFMLNLLHLYGNDNSIARVRNRMLHNLHKKLTKGYLITDIKEKFGTLRIYGRFCDEVDAAVNEVEDRVDAYFASCYHI